MTAYDALGVTPCVVWRWTSCTPDAPAQARAALRCALDQLGFDGEVISDAVLAVSEFVTNATKHAVGPYEMRLSRTAAEIICASSPPRPVGERSTAPTWCGSARQARRASRAPPSSRRAATPSPRAVPPHRAVPSP